MSDPPARGSGAVGEASSTAAGEAPAAPADADDRIEVRRTPAPDVRERLAADVRAGLGRRPRTLPPRYFYDARGSRLFEKITRLPEYYLTRAEREILETRAPDLVDPVAPGALVEFGSGSASKTRLLLDPLHEAGLRGFAPVDVSEEALLDSAVALLELYPGLRIVAVVADFTDPFPLPFAEERRLLAFLGSTIGNLEPREAETFLRDVRGRMAPEDRFLVGFDLVKDPGVLEAAYDDAAGVTAEFNRNVLRVLNRELDGDFRPESFRHRAVYDRDRARIEMHLVSIREQTVRLGALDMELRFAEGETIRTELSHKFTRDRVEALLRAAGLELERWETDARGRFALALAGPT